MTDAPNIRRGLVTCGVAFVAIAALYLGLLGLASRGQPSLPTAMTALASCSRSLTSIWRAFSRIPGLSVFVLLGRALHALMPITPSVAVASVSAIFLAAGLAAIAGRLGRAGRRVRGGAVCAADGSQYAARRAGGGDTQRRSGPGRSARVSGALGLLPASAQSGSRGPLWLVRWPGPGHSTAGGGAAFGDVLLAGLAHRRGRVPRGPLLTVAGSAALALPLVAAATSVHRRGTRFWRSVWPMLAGTSATLGAGCGRARGRRHRALGLGAGGALCRRLDLRWCGRWVRRSWGLR